MLRYNHTWFDRSDGQEPEDVERTFRLLGELHLLVTLHGLGNRQSIFGQKLVSMSLAIMGLFFFIRLVHIVPLVSLTFLLLSVDGLIYYSVMWDDACEMPRLTAELTAQLKVRIHNYCSGNGKEYLRRRLASVPSLSVKVGSFREIERNSTLLFFDFVFTTLASLLITFKA